MLRSIILAIFVAGSFGSDPKHRPPMPDSQIVGGTEVDIQNHPYQVSLQTTGHTCGGSIIGGKWIVTAGHCVSQSANRYKIKAGNTNKNLGTPYAVKRIIRHPSYDSQTIDYDIALLELDENIEFDKNVQPVKLANKELVNGVVVNVTGWGTTKQGGQTSPHLLRVSLPIVERKRCADIYTGLNVITDRMICAGVIGTGGKDSCQGDSGGPMTYNGVLYGIVSWGYGCAQPEFPGVYGNVANFRSWIKENSGI